MPNLDSGKSIQQSPNWQESDYVTNGFNLHKHSGMILLDIEKVYDTVWIYGLLYKLIIFRLPPYLLWILKEFLEGRTFTVHLNQAFSSPNATQSGYTKRSGIVDHCLCTLHL